METLSEFLRRHRTAAGLTQAALAEKAGLSEQAISLLERGARSRPRIDTIRALTAALRLGTDEAAEFTAFARGKLRIPTPDPGPSTPANSLPTPRQLPPAIPDFTGRAAQIDAILSILRSSDAPQDGIVSLVAVTGMGGIGKTTLAVQAAHRLVDAYPDGHLYLNLRGYGPGNPMSGSDALRQLLRALGLDRQLIPEGVEELAALLRSQLAGRRVLMLLDNATDVPHVLPLLPGSSGSAAIITSRDSMGALPGAQQIQLGALSETESVELLSGVIGQDRVAAEPDATERLALFTGRLPLAVRLIGARLAARPAWPIQHLVDLLDEGWTLDGLGPDETGVRASIDSSVRFLESSDRDLDREAARALPMLSVPDGSDLLTIVTAHLLDRPVSQAEVVLERLVDLNLLDSVAPGRYRFHDLIRAYARERADESLTPAERGAGLERILRFYASAAWACHGLVHQASPRPSLATTHVRPIPAFADSASALRWFDDELPNLMDRFAQVSTSPLSATALLPELALALFGYNERRGRWVEMRELGRGAVDVAERHHSLLMAAWLEHDSAIPEVENGNLESAAAHLFRALDMFHEQSDRVGQARCCSSLTYVLGHLGRIDEALKLGNQSLTLSEEVGDTTLQGVAYTAVGGLHNRTGDHARADEAFDRGIALAEKAGDIRSMFKRYHNAGFSHLAVGRYPDAIDQLQRGLTLAEQSRDDYGASEAYRTLALAFAALGDYETAQQHGEVGLALAQRLNNRLREGRILLELAKTQAALGKNSAAIANLTAAMTALRGASPIYETEAQTLLAQLQRGETYSYTPSLRTI